MASRLSTDHFSGQDELPLEDGHEGSVQCDAGQDEGQSSYKKSRRRRGRRRGAKRDGDSNVPYPQHWDQQGIDQYQEGLDQDQQGMVQYQQGMNQYQHGMNQFNHGMQIFQQGMNQLNHGMQSYQQGMIPYHQGAAQYQLGLSHYQQGSNRYPPAILIYHQGYGVSVYAQTPISSAYVPNSSLIMQSYCPYSQYTPHYASPTSDTRSGAVLSPLVRSADGFDTSASVPANHCYSGRPQGIQKCKKRPPRSRHYRRSRNAGASVDAVDRSHTGEVIAWLERVKDTEVKVKRRGSMRIPTNKEEQQDVHVKLEDGGARLPHVPVKSKSEEGRDNIKFEEEDYAKIKMEDKGDAETATFRPRFSGL